MTVSEIFARLAATMEVELFSHSGIIDVGWASSGGESTALLNTCSGGCVGGVLCGAPTAVRWQRILSRLRKEKSVCFHHA